VRQERCLEDCLDFREENDHFLVEYDLDHLGEENDDLFVEYDLNLFLQL
jgi:hypothetical protein